MLKNFFFGLKYFSLNPREKVNQILNCSGGQGRGQGDHEVRAPQQPPNVVDSERAISNQAPLSLCEVPATSTRAGAVPRAREVPATGVATGT